MALSFHANFTNSLKRNNDIFPLLQIGGSSTIYLSTRDVTVDSQAYDGRLLNAPGITSSIDLRNRTSRTNNITINIANAGYDATFGNRTNEEVIIYFATDGTTSSIGQCLKVFVGRVIGISKLNQSTISVNIEDFASWRSSPILKEKITALDGYDVPMVNKYRALHYGLYDENSSTESSADFCKNKKLRPIELVSNDIDHLYYDEGLTQDGGRPHLYVDGIDRFVPIEKSTPATTTKFGTNVVRVTNSEDTETQKDYFLHTVKVSPNTNGNHPGTMDVEVDASNAIDDDDSTEVTLTATGTSGNSPVGAFAVYSGTLTGTIKTVKAAIRAQSSADTQVFFAVLHENSSGSQSTILSETVTTANGWSLQFNNASSILESTKDITADYLNTASDAGQYEPGTNLNGLTIGVFLQNTTGTITLDLHQMNLSFTNYIEIDKSKNKSREQEYPQTLYIGTDADNLESGYTDIGISNFTPTEVHENILINFGPGSSHIDTSSETTVRGQYTDSVRCQINDVKMTVQDAILKLQKEAGFISFLRPSDGKIHYLIEDASSKSIDADLTTSMYRNIQFGTIPLNQIIWKITSNFDKHPVNGTFLTSSTTQNTTTKSTYNLGDNDGIINMNFDWVNEAEGALNLHLLYNEQRVTALCEILDPAKWTLEIGDMITFSDPPADFRFRGGNYTDYQFRITETTRTVNSLKIKAMEVHKA
jgi:hypothetical protein